MTSFKKENKTQTLEVASTTISVNAENLPATPKDVAPSEIDQSDIIVPRLNLVQSIGPNSETYTPGSLLFAQEVVLTMPAEKGKPEPEVPLTVLRIKKEYEENVEYGSEEWPRVFKTLEEVKAAGGHIEWVDGEKPPFSPIATALILIERPADCDSELFGFEHAGKRYATALWKMKGTAYTKAAKLIFTAEQFALKQGLVHGSWKLSTARVKAGKNFVWAPVLKHGPRNSDEFVKFALEVTHDN